MSSRRELLKSAGAAALFAPFANTAWSQENWPTREIHAICAYPPGSGADIFVRFYGRLLQERLGKTVIVENKVGAAGNIATEYIARSKPDGYTIGIMPGSSLLAAASSLFKKLPFDPLNDFDHITTLSKLPFVLIVSGDSPHKTVADLTAYLKQQGDKASYGSVANTGIISSELYKAAFGLPTIEVKYKDPGAMLNDLWGGNIAFAHLDPPGSMAHIKSGKVRALATSSRDRLTSMPDIASAREVGIGDADIVGWWSVHTPKGTPLAIRERLEKEFNAIAASEENRKFLAPIGSDPLVGNSEMLQKLLASEIKAWAEYVKIAKIEQI